MGRQRLSVLICLGIGLFFAAFFSDLFQSQADRQNHQPVANRNAERAFPEATKHDRGNGATLAPNRPTKPSSDERKPASEIPPNPDGVDKPGIGFPLEIPKAFETHRPPARGLADIVAWQPSLGNNQKAELQPFNTDDFLKPKNFTSFSATSQNNFSLDHFTAPYFSTQSTMNEATFVALHNNSNARAAATFSFFPRVHALDVDSVHNTVQIPPMDSILVELEQDLGVDSDMTGAFTVNVTGADPSFITIDAQVVVNRGSAAALYVPVRKPASQPASPLFSTWGPEDTLLELFNRSPNPLSISVEFYGQGAEQEITTYNVIIPPQRLELVWVGHDRGLATGEFTQGRPRGRIGSFIISSSGKAPPPTLTLGTHIFRPANDIFFVDTQKPQSAKGLVSPFFQVERAPKQQGGDLKFDTWVALVNTGSAPVTARFSFSFSRGSGKISTRTLKPNQPYFFYFSDAGINPLPGEVIFGGFRIFFSGEPDVDTSQVVAVEYLEDQSTGNHMYIPLRHPQTGRLGTYYDTTVGYETLLLLYNTFDHEMIATITFKRASDGEETLRKKGISADSVMIVALSQELTSPDWQGLGSYSIEYDRPTGGANSVQAASLVWAQNEFWWFDVKPALFPLP